MRKARPQLARPAPKPGRVDLSHLDLRVGVAIARAEMRRWRRSVSVALSSAVRRHVPLREDWDAVHDATEICAPLRRER